MYHVKKKTPTNTLQKIAVTVDIYSNCEFKNLLSRSVRGV
jgi:hypothetical protein